MAQAVAGGYYTIYVQQRVGKHDLPFQRQQFPGIADRLVGGCGGKRLPYFRQECFQFGKFLVKRGGFIA